MRERKEAEREREREINRERIRWRGGKKRLKFDREILTLEFFLNVLTTGYLSDVKFCAAFICFENSHNVFKLKFEFFDSDEDFRQHCLDCVDRSSYCPENFFTVHLVLVHKIQF